MENLRRPFFAFLFFFKLSQFFHALRSNQVSPMYRRPNPAVHRHVDEDPGNELYLKSLEVAVKVKETCELAPRQIEEMNISNSFEGSFCFYGEVLLDEGRDMYECYTALFALRNHSGDEVVTTIIDSNSKKKKNNDLKYDIFGWIIIAVGIVAWVGFAKSQMPPRPSPPLR